MLNMNKRRKNTNTFTSIYAKASVVLLLSFIIFNVFIYAITASLTSNFVIIFIVYCVSLTVVPFIFSYILDHFDKKIKSSYYNKINTK